MSKGGYQLLDFSDICDESMEYIFNEGYEIPQETEAFTIAKNAVTCGKPIILNNIQDDAAGSEFTSNFYMFSKVEIQNNTIDKYYATGIGVIYGDPVVLSITYNVRSNSIDISGYSLL